MDAGGLILDKNYKSALEMYNLSIELDDKVSDTFLKRSLCFEKLKRLNGIYYHIYALLMCGVKIFSC